MVTVPRAGDDPPSGARENAGDQFGEQPAIRLTSTWRSADRATPQAATRRVETRQTWSAEHPIERLL
jgi:hypothetical protein